jgi:hypothetical protein
MQSTQDLPSFWVKDESKDPKNSHKNTNVLLILSCHFHVLSLHWLGRASPRALPDTSTHAGSTPLGDGVLTSGGRDPGRAAPTSSSSCLGQEHMNSLNIASMMARLVEIL